MLEERSLRTNNHLSVSDRDRLITIAINRSQSAKLSINK